MPGPARTTFGTAQLLGPGADPVQARAVLVAALDAGASRLDTAPSYGAGQVETLVGEVRRSHPGLAVTTKAGLEPRPHPPAWRVTAGRVLQHAPEGLRAGLRSLRGDRTADESAPSGRFDVASVRASWERSQRALDVPVERLLLHEVVPADITDGLLELLSGLVSSGAVGEVGCATQNHLTAEVLRRGTGVLVVAHLSASPLAPPPPQLPAGVHRVHHGLLGAGGADLRRLAATGRSSVPVAAAWREVSAAAGLSGDAGLARALLRRAAHSGADEVVVASSRPERAREAVAATLAGPLPAEVARVLDDLVDVTAGRGTR